MSEQAQTTEQPKPGSPEYNETMSQKFDQQTAPDTNEPEKAPTPDMPEGGQEKFYNKESGVYDWESHAKELQFNLNGRKSPEATETKAAANAAPQIATETEVSDVVSKAGLNITQLETQLREQGDLSEDQYKALETAGVPTEIAKSYVDNLNYRIQGEREAAFGYVGGEEQWAKMSDWAVKNMDDSEIEGLNRMLDGPDYKLAMDAIKSRMGPSLVESEPSLLNGDSVTGSSFGYRAKSEMKKDMASPEYQSSPAFRQEVMKKMQSATWDLDETN